MKINKIIDSFKDEYAFLSNFYPCKVEFDGLEYKCSEAAYQAQKSSSKLGRIKFTFTNGAQSKKLGSTILIRNDWDRVKLSIMREVVWKKFTQNPVLGNMLVDTYDDVIIEENHWNDTFWGVCNGKGENHLGKILMDVRDTLVQRGF